MQPVKKDPQQKVNLVQRLSEAFTQELIDRPFPVDRLSIEWVKAAYLALRRGSPQSIGISASEFKNIWEKYNACSTATPELSYFQFAMLSNNLENKTCDDLHYCQMEDYLEIMEETAQHVEFFREQHAIIRKEVETRIANEDALTKKMKDGVKAEA